MRTVVLPVNLFQLEPGSRFFACLLASSGTRHEAKRHVSRPAGQGTVPCTAPHSPSNLPHPHLLIKLVN